MARKGSEVSASNRYPLRSAQNSGRVLRPATTKNNKACSEPLNDTASAQPETKKAKSGSLSGSPSSVRVLRSASKNKDEASSKPLYDSTSRELSVDKRKGVGPSKVERPKNSIRVLCSASKNNNESYSEPLNNNTARTAAKRRKSGSSSNVRSPVTNARVLRSTTKMENEACHEPPNDVASAQPVMRKRKNSTPSKMDAPKVGARVLRSASKKDNEACTEPLNDSTVAPPAARKRKGDTLTEMDNAKIGVRVLRSASQKKNEACDELINGSTSAQPATRKRKGVRPLKDRSPKKEYIKINQRVRYILNRMSYEQSLIQAYSSEGWKGQSLEKIRPEKELERAKAEILQCKLRIREAFWDMDLLLSEGKLDESLFDSAGEIFSEDIFCAICGSKDVTLQNDIILCDGACDRGFHQNCLSPPLLTKDIPSGDERWYCPACVCKMHCMDALNELQGSKLSIHDSWEKVFPEAAPLANGCEQVNARDLPLDDSGDAYNPALAQGHVLNEGRSLEDEGKDNARTLDDLGLPSEDSEDDDFDPAGPCSSEDQKKESSSGEDFTSDSDDFCAEIAKSVSPLSNVRNRTYRTRNSAVDNHSNEENSNRTFMETELEEDVVLPVSSRRQLERLDYKKLYDEAYGKESSDSSDDEEWSGEEQLEGSEADSHDEPLHSSKSRSSARTRNSKHSPQREWLSAANEQQTEVIYSNATSSTSKKHHPTVSKKLKSHFETDPYPSRATKESLAQELGLTFNQVCRWFSSTRHYTRASAKKEKRPDDHTTKNSDGTAVNSIQRRETDMDVMEKSTLDVNYMVPEKPIVLTDLNKCIKEDIPLSGTEIEMESYGKESSDSSDEDWSALSTPQKGRLQENETLGPAERRSRRAPAMVPNNEQTPSKQILGSASEQKTEVLRSTGSSSTSLKGCFGPIVTQKLKDHFDKEPYPNRSTKESLAQELGLTFIQVTKWFSGTRHRLKITATKNKEDPGKHTTKNNDNTGSDSLQIRQPKVLLMDKSTVDRSDMVSKFNLNESNEEDIFQSQNTCSEQRVIMSPANISREVNPPGYSPGENQGSCGLRNSGYEQRVVTAPTAVSSELGPPGYEPGGNQGDGDSRNTGSEQQVFMTPTISRPPGYGLGENLGDGSSRNTGYKQSVFMTPATILRECGPPGYMSGGNRGNDPWSLSCEQGVFMSPQGISKEVGPPGHGPGGNQGNDTSWSMKSCEQRIFTSPTTVAGQAGPPGFEPGGNCGSVAFWSTTSCDLNVSMSPPVNARDVSLPGYGAGTNQGNGASWNTSCQQRIFTSPTTISRDDGTPGSGLLKSQGAGGGPGNVNWGQGMVTTTPTTVSFPPGYGPGENQRTSASSFASSPKGRPAEKVELDEARRKAIQRELRKRQKFR